MEKERDRVLDYERQDLDIIVENSDEYIHQRDINWIFRIGIKTNGRKSIHNVGVTIIKRNGNKHAYPDAMLRPAYSLFGEPGTFTVKPDTINFVEVCSWDKNSNELRMHYHISPYSLSVGIPKEETLTLCVTGNDTQSKTITLRVNTSDIHPKWEVIKEV